MSAVWGNKRWSHRDFVVLVIRGKSCMSPENVAQSWSSTRSRSGIWHRSRHSQFWGWRKVVPVCSVLNVSNPCLTGKPWSKKNNKEVHELDCFPHGAMLLLLLLLESRRKTSVQNEVVLPKECLTVFPNYCCPERWFRWNRISPPEWVKLCVEINYAPNKKSFCCRQIDNVAVSLKILRLTDKTNEIENYLYKVDTSQIISFKPLLIK